MAKRGRPARSSTLDGLVGQLHTLDKQRRRVINQIRQATDRLLSGENPFPWSSQRGRAAAGGPAAAANGDTTVRKRKRRRMSAEAREKIAAAQRARWAKYRKAAGKSG